MLGNTFWQLFIDLLIYIIQETSLAYANLLIPAKYDSGLGGIIVGFWIKALFVNLWLLKGGCKCNLPGGL